MGAEMICEKSVLSAIDYYLFPIKLNPRRNIFLNFSIYHGCAQERELSHVDRQRFLFMKHISGLLLLDNGSLSSATLCKATNFNQFYVFSGVSDSLCLQWFCTNLKESFRLTNRGDEVRKITVRVEVLRQTDSLNC